MAPERISMRKIKEVLRLHFEAGLSGTTIAKVVNISRFTVQQYNEVYRCRFKPNTVHLR